jgi:hypothetical protein
VNDSKFKIDCISGDTWQSRRKLLNPSFSVKILKSFLVIFDKKFKILCEVLNVHLKDNSSEFDIWPILYRASLDIIFGDYIFIKTLIDGFQTTISVIYQGKINYLFYLMGFSMVSTIENPIKLNTLPVAIKIIKLFVH